jgi:hypothetical protein
MLSIDYIKQINQERAREAASENLEPFVYYNVDEVSEMIPFPFAHIGDYRPEGWLLVDRHFVDSSGFGADDEPAMSLPQFVALLEERVTERPGTGWAVIEAGQFQVYVGEFVWVA